MEEDLLKGELVDYLIVKALGTENLIKAMTDKTTVDVPQWRLHTITHAGLTVVEHPLHPSRGIQMMQFILIFERPTLGAEA